MKKHIKLKFEQKGWQVPEDAICEVCGKRAVDVHHIESRGMGGSKTKDHIENLIALCRECHEKAHFQREPYLSKEELKRIAKEH